MHSAGSAPARIIVLNGASSSGKSSLARAMQRKSDVPLHHVQLDAFRAMEPPGYWDGWEQRDEGSRQAMMRALCGAMFAAVLAYSRHGQQVMLDVALTNPQARRLLVDYLQGWPAYLVGVHCSREELERREALRGDRQAGLAASQVEWIHRQMVYDLEIDTGGKDPGNLAIEVLGQLATAPAPAALRKLGALQQTSAPVVRRIHIGAAGKPQLLADLHAAGVRLNDAAQALFADDRFEIASNRSVIEIVELTIASLTGGDGARFDQIVERAAARGLSLCPLELGPHFRLQYLDQPEGASGHPPSRHRAPPGSITVASAPLADDDDTPKGFYLRRIQGVPWLRGYRSWPGHVWSPDDVFAFARLERHE